MSCTQWKDSLIGRLYGDIGADDDALTEHLAACASCRQTLDEFGRVRASMRADEHDALRIPRVVVLRDRFRFRPSLLAASLLAAAVLAGAGAGAGYALGSGHVPAKIAAIPAVPPSTTELSTEELVRREVDRRVSALQQSRSTAVSSKPVVAAALPSGERAVSPAELRAEIAKLERRINGARAADLDYALDQIAASEVRTGARLGLTNQALRTVALASNPRVNEQ